MEGLTLLPFASAPATAPVLSTDLLAIVVSIVAFCVSGIFLLLLMPETSLVAAHAAAARGDADTAIVALPSGEAAPPQVRATNDGNGRDRAATDDAEFDREPLGGVGASPRRLARHLPIERDGSTHFVAVEDVIAIHANAHYTFIFNGSDKLFCPLAIGDVESRLDGSRFVRIHRSHIVNIDRVVGYRRSGDNELVEMEAAGDYAVPVSRSRIGWLKSRVAALTGDNPAVALRRRHHIAAQ